MATPLHIAHVHQPPPPPKRKRKGGGGGKDGYDELVERIYRDRRMTPESRELLLLLAWLIKRDPERRDADGEYVSTWDRAGRILGSRPRGRQDRPRVADLVDADRPRYEPDWGTWGQTCRAPMIRRAGECGQHATGTAYSIDPATGWRTPQPYCRRHAEWGHGVDAARHALGPVEPIPNAGGLMPAYLVLKTGDDGWNRVYGWASQWTHSRWEPPVKYGLCADSWPLPGEEPEPEPVRLRLAAVDGELIGGAR